MQGSEINQHVYNQCRINKTYRNGEAGRHAVQIVRMLTHCHDFGYDRLIRPLNAKDFCELLQVLSRGFTNGEDGVAQPAHAQTAEFFVKKLNAELRSKERNIFDDGQADAPLLVFSELNNSGEEGLRQEFNANYCSGQDSVFV